MKVIIIAGGRGTRMESIKSSVPKGLLKINGKPVIEHQIELAKKFGHTDITICIGFLGQQIKDYFTNGTKWGVKINYSIETHPLGTSGALAKISSSISEDCFIFYGDTLMNISLDLMYEFHKQNNSDITLLVHPNDHPFDSDLVQIDSNNKVLGFLPSPHSNELIYNNLVNAALYILSPKAISLIPKGKKSDFGKDIFPKNINSNIRMYAYKTAEYIKDMGTPKRYEEVINDFNSGIISKLGGKKKAVFIDRDGVIIKDEGLVYKLPQVKLIDGAAEGIRCINQNGYLAVVVTNQSVIARNLCSFDELDNIHKKMEVLLGKKNAFVDNIYFCPHHPDKGYPEERKEYKVKCSCRKPEPGLILSAIKEMNIDINNSLMIGDRLTDIQAAKKVGVSNILVETNKPNELYNVFMEFINK
jgi:mannose-1-phosphate guanylyltransferase / phosphomannomutase